MHTVLAHRPEQHAGELSVPPTTDHKQLRVVRSSYEHRSWPALLHDEVSVDVGPENLFDGRLERSASVALWVEAGGQLGRPAPRDWPFPSRDDIKTGAGELCLTTCPAQRLLARLRAVDSYDNHWISLPFILDLLVPALQPGER